MPTHPLISYMESPDGLVQELLDNASASMPGLGSSMTPHGTAAGEKPADGGLPVDCMFCDQTFQRQDELSPHVLTQHPTTLFGPAVLRVEAEFLAPGERARAASTSSRPAADNEDSLSCEVCGQALGDPTELEGHMRKHRDSFTYSCGLCGRRFREPWFLKNHMRTHASKAGARGRAQQDADSPATINNVVVGQTSSPAVSSPYRMCMVCGFFFPSKEVLVEHSKAHNHDSETGDEEACVSPRSPPEAPLSKQAFLQLLGLRSSLPLEASLQTAKSAKWIPELDPFNTYQAWQLATKGKVAVGPGLAKELGPDAPSDAEDSGSDKEELGEIWTAGQNSKCIKDGLRRELRPRRSGGETPSPEPEQKSLPKEKPTQCKDCGKTFRTYHQLVLHSRVHKKDRAEAESPTASMESKQAGTNMAEGGAGALDRAEEVSEDGSEEGGTADTCQSDKSEDCFDISKLKILAPSKECSYCGKYFRSNYYLNIHLRMHTGEKPYKCEYCDYAAAQKTSLRYHLDRRHKGMPEPGSSAKMALPSPPAGDTKDVVPPQPAEGRGSTGMGADTSCSGIKDEAEEEKVSWQASEGDSGSTAPGAPRIIISSDAGGKEAPKQADMKLEGDVKEVKQEYSEPPLNLSLGTSLSDSATSVPKSTLITSACPLCSYKTLYPEVLLMHKALAHKEKGDATKKAVTRSTVAVLKHKRRTGCPPALEGKDVAPLAPPHSRHPRRTKSPPPQLSRPSEKVPPAQAAKHLSTAESRRVSPRDTHVGSLRARQGTSRLPECQSEWNSSLRRDGATADKEATGQRPRQARNGAWPTDAMMSCLSARFGSLPQTDAGEPCSKRAKYLSATARELEPSEAAGLRQGESYARFMPQGRNAKPPLQRSPPTRVTKAFGPGKSAAPPAADMDWNVINILRSYSPSDLASLYQPAVASSSHGAIASSAPGNRPLHHQHYPPSVLQRRHNVSPMSNARCGPTDKSA